MIDTPITISKRLLRIAQYEQIFREIREGNDEKQWGDLTVSAQRALCQSDLFYLLVYGCQRSDISRDWLFDRCNEVQIASDGYLDLWAREHYKSTIITFGKSIQDILKNPEITIGIFSHTSPQAKSFLSQIKRELETNRGLQQIFPDILYQDAKKEAPRAGQSWSVDKGITVKRKSNPKEPTVDASGLVDGQPTGMHYAILNYDDIVTLESVSSPDQIKKTTDALAMSYNLGAAGGVRRFIGTRYHLFDTYKEIMSRGTVTQRIYPATDNGKLDGKPVFLTQEVLDGKRRDMGPYIYASQMLQNPVADAAQGFQLPWLRYYNTVPNLEMLNIYIVVDPANDKKKRSDYTVMWVIGLGRDRNYYIIDCIYDRLNLTERADALFRLHSEYHPLDVGYERYGMQGDIQHIESEMDRRHYRFGITELHDNTPKNDRIKRLVPLFEQGRIWLPRALHKYNSEGNKIDVIKLFVETEFEGFPVCLHDDMLDDLANIVHPMFFPVWPQVERKAKVESWEHKLSRKMREQGRLIGDKTSHMAR